MDFIVDIFDQMQKVIEETEEIKKMIANWKFSVFFSVTNPPMTFTIMVENSSVKFLNDKIDNPTAVMTTSFPVLAQLFTAQIAPHKAIFEADHVEVTGSLLAVQKLKELMEITFAKLEEENSD
ncbi:MAG: SCP2 sterol-binding domain-containing protein [Candidatus Odinarchaeota archaeon]